MQPHQIVKADDVDLAVYRWGESSDNAQEKPMVVLVHGYPDAACVWETCAKALAKHYQVVAYDVRGAGRSSRPANQKAYELEYLVRDLGHVLDAVNPAQPVHLVAHDWGSIQCWEAVTTEALSGRFASYTSISGPCLDHVGFWIRKRLANRSIASLAQLARQAAHSWYIGLFHLPVLAPLLWNKAGANLWPVLLEKVEGIADSPASATQQLDGVHGVNLYRANVRERVLRPQQRSTDMPVHLICPKNDHFMVGEIWDDLSQWAPNLWRSDVDGGHWLQVSHPELLVEKVSQFVDFLESGKGSAAMKAARCHVSKNTKPVNKESLDVCVSA